MKLALHLFTFLFLHNVTLCSGFVKPKVRNFALKATLDEEIQFVQIYKNNFLEEDYNNILQDISDHKVGSIFLNNNGKQIVSVDNLPQGDNIKDTIDNVFYSHYHLAQVNPFLVTKIVDKATESNVPLHFIEFTPQVILNIENLIINSLAFVGNFIPLFFIIYILSIFSSGANNFSRPSSMNTKVKTTKRFNPFGNMPNTNNNEQQFMKQNISLDSWVGSPEIIEECKEVVSYLEKKELYNQIGAEMPKGILLEGPPGTGKTLLAKAIATETNSTFITMSGSEFVELFVGMGALRVRELFSTARENAPSIIFIDEIDAIGKQRGTGMNTNDEREQTLNQLLYEMDGFKNNDNILIMAATNRKNILDQALLRPGRFDRMITVSLPDKESRKQILSFYLKDKPVDKTIDVDVISELADGFSGADLKNLVNEAAIISVRNNQTMIKEEYIYESFEKSVIGLIKKNATVAPATKLRVAIHESGHSLLALKFKDYFDFQKASIQPTYSGAGGYTIFNEKPEIKNDGLYTKDVFQKRLIVMMGGKAAESIYYGNNYVSLGAIEDLRQANKLARRMVSNYGMGEKLEVFSDGGLDEDIMSRNMNSEYTKYTMDKEVLALVNNAFNEAKKILKDHEEQMIEFSFLLQNNTVIYKKDIGNVYLEAFCSSCQL